MTKIPIVQPYPSSKRETSSDSLESDGSSRLGSEPLVLEYLGETPAEEGLSAEESVYKHFGIRAKLL